MINQFQSPIILNSPSEKPLTNLSSPYQQKTSDAEGKSLKATTKSYHNMAFLNSHPARIIRILCEFEEPGKRLGENDIRGTILVFGSARSMTTKDFTATMLRLDRERDQLKNEVQKEKEKIGTGGCVPVEKNSNDKLIAQLEDRIFGLTENITKFTRVKWMCPWVEKVEELCRRLTVWSCENASHICKVMKNDIPDYYLNKNIATSHQPLVITTGGGPGLMEAANRGASQVPGAKTMGMGITLPFEKGLNPYVSDGLEFEFHYFFTRKFWMMYSARALIVCPGGFGTFDELFELLTLRQTRKVPHIPIVLMCSKFWKSVINWESLAEYGVVSLEEANDLLFADTVEEAFEYVTGHFPKNTEEQKHEEKKTLENESAGGVDIAKSFSPVKDKVKKEYIEREHTETHPEVWSETLPKEVLENSLLLGGQQMEFDAVTKRSNTPSGKKMLIKRTYSLRHSETKKLSAEDVG